MASTKGTEAIARLLECPICLEHQKDSRILPCLHSLCFECLLKYVTLSSAEDGETDSMRCPSCRKECKIPDGGVGEFPKNFLINSLEDCFKDVKVERPELPEGAGSEPGICQNSAKAGRHGAVVVFCKECNLYICQSCSDSHSFFDSTQNHSLISVKVTEANVDLPCCKLHDDHKMALYCRTCDKAVCSMCCLESHKDHHYVELPAASEECGSLLEKMKIEVCQLIAELDRITEELSQTQTTMKADFNLLRDEIDIVEGNSSLLNKLKSCEEEALMVVNSAVKEHELQKTNAMSLQSYIETLRQPSPTDHHGLITSVRGLKKQLTNQKAQLPSLAKWTLLRVRLEKSASKVAEGEISMTTTRSSASSSSGCRDDGQIQLGRSVQTINLKCSKIAPAFVVTRGVVVVVHWGDPHLWVYSTGGFLIKRSRVTDMQYAAGMALLPADEIKVIITDFSGAFFVVTVSPRYDIRRQVKTKVPFVPRRVCVDNTGEPIVASNSAKEILQLDAAANIVRRIPIDKQRIWSLWCAAKDGEEYMMADSGNNIVAWADSSGTITHIYGNRQGEDLHHPCHLVKDGQGRTIVVDHMNDAVQLLGTDRTYLQHLLTRRDGIESPTSVHLDEESGLLYVAHGPENAPKVNVYNYITNKQSISGNVTHLQLTVKL